MERSRCAHQNGLLHMHRLFLLYNAAGVCVKAGLMFTVVENDVALGSRRLIVRAH